MLKNVQFMPRFHAEAIIPRSTSAMISISGPNNPARLNQLWHRGNLIRLQFHDADEVGRVSRRLDYPGESKYIQLFTPKDAKHIIDFVNEVKNKVDVILVHCDAGISRSAAVAKFIAEMFNLPFPESYMLYNKYVYRVLKNTYNSMMWDENYEP